MISIYFLVLEDCTFSLEILVDLLGAALGSKLSSEESELGGLYIVSLFLEELFFFLLDFVCFFLDECDDDFFFLDEWEEDFFLFCGVSKSKDPSESSELGLVDGSASVSVDILLVEEGLISIFWSVGRVFNLLGEIFSLDSLVSPSSLSPLLLTGFFFICFIFGGVILGGFLFNSSIVLWL